MCKNFMLTTTNNLTESQFLKLRQIVAEKLTSGRDNDGFGYATFNQSGEVFGERFLETRFFNFQMLPNVVPKEPRTEIETREPKDIPTQLRLIFNADKIAPPKAANFFGTYSRPVGAFIAHGRLSTNAVTIGNTHPHRSANFTLIHNGVVQNVGDLKVFDSTCDSEFLVKYFEKGGLNSMVSGVTGNYAIGILEHNTHNLCIIKDDRTDLFGAWVPHLGATAIATSQEHLHDILKSMKWKHSKIRELVNSTCSTFDVNGVLIDTCEFTPQKWASYKAPEEVTPKKSNSDWYREWNERERNATKKALEAEKAYSNPYMYELEEADLYNREYWFETQSGSRISYQLYMALTPDEQDLCIVTEKDTGKKIMGGV